jgi:hypothetical protein
MAERMGEKEFKKWNERLRYAKDIWKRRGLIGTENVSNMRMLIEFNRGNQWQHINGGAFGSFHSEDLATVNKVFPIANTILGDIGSRNPQVQVTPRQEEYQLSARPVEHLINYDIEELNFKRQTNRALAHHLFAPFGLVRNGFTPSDEWQSESGRQMQLYRPAKPDRPWIQHIPCWNVLIDPKQVSFHAEDGCRWVAFREIMTLDNIRDNPNMIDRKGLGGFAGNVGTEWKQTETWDYIDVETDPDRENDVEVWTVYEAEERTWFQMTLDGLDKPLREREDWPIPWETLPYSVLAVNEQMDTPFNIAIMDEIRTIQEDLNKLRTLMHLLVHRLPRVIGVDKNKIEPDMLAILQDASVKEIIEFAGGLENAMSAISTGAFPQELLQYNALLEEDLREVIGQSKMGRAQRINVDTATEAASVQQGQDVNTARIADGYEDFNKDVIRLHMQGRRATMALTGDEIVRVVGQNDSIGVQEWASVTVEDMHKDYDFHVIHGSTRKRDHDADAVKAAQDFQLAASAPEIFNTAFYARKFVEARGYPLQDAMVPDALSNSRISSAAATVQNAREGVGEQKGGGTGGTGGAGGGIPPEVAQLLGGGGQ